ncbi:MAG: hypothetical protein ACP5GC_05095 [Thiomonas sp.]
MPKVLMLLALIVFVVGVIQTCFTPEKTRAILADTRQDVGNVLAASLYTFSRGRPSSLSRGGKRTPP